MREGSSSARRRSRWRLASGRLPVADADRGQAERRRLDMPLDEFPTLRMLQDAEVAEPAETLAMRALAGRRKRGNAFVDHPRARIGVGLRKDDGAVDPSACKSASI